MPEETTVKVADLEAANRVIEELRARNAVLRRAIELMTQASNLQHQIMEEVLLLKERRES
jgi:hypothetical protein